MEDDARDLYGTRQSLTSTKSVDTSFEATTHGPKQLRNIEPPFKSDRTTGTTGTAWVMEEEKDNGEDDAVSSVPELEAEVETFCGGVGSVISKDEL